VSGYRLTPAAQLDLSSIWDFTQEQWDIRQAETYVTEIRNAIERIAERPERGRMREEIREGYWCYAIGSRLIFYVARSEGIDVIRILHQLMDPTRHL